MTLRKEPIVFLIVALVVGALAWAYLPRASAPLRGGARGEPPELVHYPPPDVARALPLADERLIARDPFAEPSNTRPLQPLELVDPPRAALPVLLPPPEPGPAPRLYSSLLAHELAVTEVPGLFSAESEAAPEQAEAQELLQQFSALKDQPKSALDPKTAVIPAAKAASQSPAPETAEERAARIESCKQIYDWIQLDELDFLFGRIENPDRLGLSKPSRLVEPILFDEVEPLSGKPRFPGQPAIRYERARIKTFALADTPANGLEIRRFALGDKLSRSLYSQALELADECVELRLQAPRGLEMAEELYRELTQLDPQDPAPRLGLARCQEAGFDFEHALSTYQELLATFDHRALVHVRLAGLMERFLLYERAEAEYRAALARERGSYEANWSYGRFLLARGRELEALAHLEQAHRFAPDVPERKEERVTIRVDYGSALLRAGKLDEARELFRQALQADAASQPALAGLVSVALLARPGAPGTPGAPGADGSAQPARDWPAQAARDWTGLAGADWLAGAQESAAGLQTIGQELLLAGGLYSAARLDWVQARDRLLRAAKADPLRASLSWRALAHVAEVTGYPEEAYRYVELAVDADPSDPWTQYQRGRLLLARSDAEGAERAFKSALEREIDFEAVLLQLAELCYARSRHPEAERYLDQALRLEPKHAASHVLRGLNYLHMGEHGAARAAFQQALAIEPQQPSAASGLAWCVYRGGDSKEAMIQLGALADRRRNFPEDDPYRRWANGQIARLKEHIDKTLWSDRFDRNTLKNGWTADEGAGPIASMLEGGVKLEGVFKEKGSVRVFQTFKSASLFVSIEVDLRVSDQCQARAGLFVAREKERSRGLEVLSEARVSRHPDGPLQVRFVKSGEAEAPESDIVGVAFPAGKWVRLRIEMGDDAASPSVNVWVDGLPVRENVPMPGLGRASTELRAGLFVEGEVGRNAMVQMDNCDIVYRTGG